MYLCCTESNYGARHHLDCLLAAAATRSRTGRSRAAAPPSAALRRRLRAVPAPRLRAAPEAAEAAAAEGAKVAHPIVLAFRSASARTSCAACSRKKASAVLGTLDLSGWRSRASRRNADLASRVVASAVSCSTCSARPRAPAARGSPRASARPSPTRLAPAAAAAATPAAAPPPPLLGSNRLRRRRLRALRKEAEGRLPRTPAVRPRAGALVPRHAPAATARMPRAGAAAARPAAAAPAAAVRVRAPGHRGDARGGAARRRR